MSHFTVMVVTENGTQEELEAILQPYHEYECTGVRDEHVVWVSHKEEATKDWESDEKHSYFDGKTLKEHYGDFETFVSDYHGYEINDDGDVGTFTNPNSKWDWWTIGGRWSNFLTLNDGGDADSAMVDKIDWAEMIREHVRTARVVADRVDEILSVLSESDRSSFKSWTECREMFDENDKARSYFWAQPVMAALEEARKAAWNDSADPLYGYHDLEPFARGGDAYVDNRRKSALATFAFLDKEGWKERGNMGWFGFFGNEDESWHDDFGTLIGSIPDGHFVTIVDCHI